MDEHFTIPIKVSENSLKFLSLNPMKNTAFSAPQNSCKSAFILYFWVGTKLKKFIKEFVQF